MTNITDNLRIKSLRPISSPALLIEQYSLSEVGAKLISETRNIAENIIVGKDDRLVVIVGT